MLLSFKIMIDKEAGVMKLLQLKVNHVGTPMGFMINPSDSLDYQVNLELLPRARYEWSVQV